MKDLLQMFPAERIKPVDGMAVTAQVWEESHEYHRQYQRFHTRFYHGAGVVTGLEVIASDPPDTSVYILPGVAVDPAGQTIVLPQPVSYDIGHEMEGLLYLLLSYGESRPRVDKGRSQGDGVMHVHTEFSISARTALPNTPWVELARIERDSREDPFLDAQNPIEPGPNEIDLRFRREIGAPGEVNVGVCYLGEVTAKKHGRGASYLAHTLNHLGRYHVSVDDDVPLAPGIEANTIIYLVGEGEFELSSGQMNGLFNHVTRGRGTLFIESNDSAAKSSFLNILRDMGIKPEALQPGHHLLTYPYLFVAPPRGFETEDAPEDAPGDAPEVLVNDGVIFSTCNYGLMWQGEIRDDVPSREQIRSAIEWGSNIIAYARGRRRRK
jgi:hypothetical protein